MCALMSCQCMWSAFNLPSVSGIKSLSYFTLECLTISELMRRSSGVVLVVSLLASESMTNWKLGSLSGVCW